MGARLCLFERGPLAFPSTTGAGIVPAPFFFASDGTRDQCACQGRAAISCGMKSMRTECLDHAFFFGESHLYRAVLAYVGCFNYWDPHRSSGPRAPRVPKPFGFGVGRLVTRSLQRPCSADCITFIAMRHDGPHLQRGASGSSPAHLLRTNAFGKYKTPSQIDDRLRRYGFWQLGRLPKGR